MGFRHHSADPTSIGLARASATCKNEHAIAFGCAFRGQGYNSIKKRLCELFMRRSLYSPDCGSLLCGHILATKLRRFFSLLSRTGQEYFAFVYKVLLDWNWSVSCLEGMCIKPVGQQVHILKQSTLADSTFTETGKSMRRRTGKVALMPTICIDCPRQSSFVAKTSKRYPRCPSSIMCNSSRTTALSFMIEPSSMAVLTREFA